MENIDDKIKAVISNRDNKGKFIEFSNAQQELIYRLDFDLSNAFQSMLNADGNAAQKAQVEYERIKAQAKLLNDFFGYMVVNIPE